MKKTDWYYGTDSITGQEQWSVEAHDARLKVWRSVRKECGYVWFIEWRDGVRVGFCDTPEDARAKCEKVAKEVR